MKQQIVETGNKVDQAIMDFINSRNLTSEIIDDIRVYFIEDKKDSDDLVDMLSPIVGDNMSNITSLAKAILKERIAIINKVKIEEYDLNLQLAIHHELGHIKDIIENNFTSYEDIMDRCEDVQLSFSTSERIAEMNAIRAVKPSFEELLTNLFKLSTLAAGAGAFVEMTELDNHLFKEHISTSVKELYEEAMGSIAA